MSHKRRLTILLLNVVAVLGPPAALYALYGPAVTVEATNPAHVLPLVGAMVAAFLIGTLAGMVATRSASEGFAALFAVLTKAMHGAPPPTQHPRASRRAA